MPVFKSLWVCVFTVFRLLEKVNTCIDIWSQGKERVLQFQGCFTQKLFKKKKCNKKCNTVDS